MLKGKFISILGDSISTYKGVSDDNAANSSLLYNPYFYRGSFPLEKTYWGRLIDKFGLRLCVNNSWSSGNLSGTDNPDSGINRANRLSRDDGTDPDIVIVFMGLNDLGRKVALATFSSDYKRTLATIKDRYPKASVCCVNLPDRDVVMRQAAESFNAEIQKAVFEAGSNFFIADLFNSRLNNDFYYMNTVDGIHPDEDGMKIIAEVIEEAFLAHLCEQ